MNPGYGPKQMGCMLTIAGILVGVKYSSKAPVHSPRFSRAIKLESC